MSTFHIIQAHALETLVKRREQVLAAPVIAIGARPHVIARLGRNDELVPVGTKVVYVETTHITLRLAVLRAVVVRQVKVRNAMVKSRAHDVTHLRIRREIPEVVPHPQAQGTQLEPGISAATILHRRVTVWRG